MLGEALGPYRIERELGTGGMGTVYSATLERKAVGLDPGTRVAVKVVHAHLMETEGFFKRFLREGEVGKAVRHENVVATYDCDALGSQMFLVMEYVEGQTLRDLLAELDRVPEELCRHVGREIARGLAAIHEAGVVHRDIKPENVIISLSAAKPDDDVAERPASKPSRRSSNREGNVQPQYEHVVKVMDLGVARLQDEAVKLSQTGAFVGSLHYAAPEQFGGGAEIDHRADLHALGLLLYELACGQHPYYDEDFRVVLERLLHEEPRRVAEINPQLSPFLEEVIHKLIAKEREERFATAGEVAAILDAGESSEWWQERAKAMRIETKQPLRRIRIVRETALYGRDKELAKLHALFEDVKGYAGRVLLVEGEAGVGKTRLVDEFVGRLRQAGEDLNFLFGSYPPGGAATAAGAFSTAYREHFGEIGLADTLAEYLTTTPVLIPAFAALLNGDATPEGKEPLTKDSLQTVFVHATRALAAERPTIVLIDDLHFAPDDGRALFAALGAAVTEHPILLVGTTRPGLAEDWVANLQRLEHTAHIPVERLFPKDLIRLLEDSLRSKRLAEQLGVQIAMKSDGNPFFIFEIIRGLREGQFITQEQDGSWVSTRVIDQIQIPSSVMDLIHARIADLTEEEKDLLDVASCCGFEFDPSLVAAALDMKRIPALKRFGSIEKTHRLVRSSGRRMVFDHHQVQESLYSGLLEQLREEYHAALAEALETREGAAEKDPETLPGALCVTLCEHFLAGARGEAALRYLPAAQSHLSDGYLHAQVVTLSERALAVPGLLEGAPRAQALLRLVKSLSPMGRRDREEACAREAERLSEEAGDEERRGKAARALGVCLNQVSRHEEAEAAHRRALEIARSRGDKKEEAAATGNQGNVFWSQGRVAEAKEYNERALALFREIGDRRGEANATGNLGNVFWAQGRLAEAKEHYERDLALSREIGNRQAEANTTGNLGLVFRDQGRLAEANDHFERHLALSREIGYRQGEATATGNLGSVFLSQGRLAEAKEHHERHLALSREIGNRQAEAAATGNLGLVFDAQGRLAEAKEHYERQIALCSEIGDRQGEATAQHNLGAVLREEGESAGSEERLLACLALAEEIGHRYVVAHTQLALGSLRAARSRAAGSDGAWAALEAARDVAAEVGVPGVETLARCELALLREGDDGGDAEDALAAFAEHGERLDAGERREARLLLFRATGDRAHLEAAKRLLDEALALVPAEYHEAMCRNRRVNREILEAWAAQGGATG